MKLHEFIDCVGEKGRDLLDDDIRSLELDLGVQLPKDYADFLKTCNGGYAMNEITFSFRKNDGLSDASSLANIGGVRNDETDLSLLESHEIYQVEQKRIACDLLWIMGTHNGDAVCIGLPDSIKGRVYFWDQAGVTYDDSPLGLPDGCGNVYELAGSFEEFIGLLEIDF